MPRKALAPARAALRFAQKAADEDGPVQQADAGCFKPFDGRTDSCRHRSLLNTPSQRWDVVGRQAADRHGNHRHRIDTSKSWTRHALLFSNSAIAAAHHGKPPHSRRSERSTGRSGQLEHG